MEVSSLADQITRWLQAARAAVPWAFCTRLRGRFFGFDHRTGALAPSSLPRQPQGQGRICGLISSPTPVSERLTLCAISADFWQDSA